MRPELRRLILNARARLGGYTLSADEAEDNTRRQEIEEFQTLLAGKIDLATRLELLLDAEYVWQETGPAVRFDVDGHTFVIARGEGECQLSEDCKGEPFLLARLAESDSKFEDRLLLAIGSILEPVRH